MRPPSSVTVDFGTDSTTPGDFEQVPPSSNAAYWNTAEELPLHYMAEETTRRRVPRGPTGGDSDGAHLHDGYDEDEKYAKMKAPKSRVGSGKIARPPPPPPTSIVSLVVDVSV
jgi:dolichyl-phosphate-mannose-protein mannosyltransferase